MTGRLVAQRVGGGRLRRPSAPRGIGGLGDGAEGRALRAVFHADAFGLPGLRAQEKGTGTFCRTAPEGFRKRCCPFSLRYLAVLACFIVAWQPSRWRSPCRSCSAVGLLAAGAVERHKAAIVDRVPRGDRQSRRPERRPSARRRVDPRIPLSVRRARSPSRLRLGALPARGFVEADPGKDPAVGDCLPFLPAGRPRSGNGALEVNQQYSFAWRIGNALISYVAYLGQLFCPCELGALLSPPARAVAALAGGRGGSDAGGHHGGGVPAAAGSARTCWSAGCGTSGCSCR